MLRELFPAEAGATNTDLPSGQHAVALPTTPDGSAIRGRALRAPPSPASLPGLPSVRALSESEYFDHDDDAFRPPFPAGSHAGHGCGAACRARAHRPGRGRAPRGARVDPAGNTIHGR